MAAAAFAVKACSSPMSSLLSASATDWGSASVAGCMVSNLTTACANSGGRIGIAMPGKFGVVHGMQQCKRNAAHSLRQHCESLTCAPPACLSTCAADSCTSTAASCSASC